VQLTAARRRAIAVLCAVVGAAVGTLAHGGATADGVFTTTNTFFQEFGGPLRMTVFTPGAGARVDVGEHLTLSASWDADILTGASVRTVDAPSTGADVIATATRVEDIRNQAHAGITLRDDLGSLRLGYTYGTENDYRSNAFDATARTELFERDTAFEISYARGFDEVCDLDQTQGGAHTVPAPVLRRAMPTSEHCFSGMPDRVTHDLSLQNFGGSWTQAWLPIFATQATISAQLIDGFQSNPYRAVWLGRAAAQEHEPEFRARYALGVSGRLWLEPLKGALSVLGRGYLDTWGIRSITGELAWEQTIGAGLSLRVRGRYYAQSAAAFFSDDYGHVPRGDYFTGDRELAEMHSVTLGGRLNWEIPAGGDGKVLGFLQGLTLVLKGDYMMFDFPGFHYGMARVPNDKAIVATFGLEAVF
jgi:hypothetical protein